MKLSERFLEQCKPREFSDIELYGKICSLETKIEIMNDLQKGLVDFNKMRFPKDKDVFKNPLQIIKDQIEIHLKELNEIAKLNHIEI